MYTVVKIGGYMVKLNEAYSRYDIILSCTVKTKGEEVQHDFLWSDHGGEDAAIRMAERQIKKVQDGEKMKFKKAQLIG